MTTPSAPGANLTVPRLEPMKEIRFAVVMYGGVSLAIYINGIAQELLSLVRSTAEAYEEENDRAVLSGDPILDSKDSSNRRRLTGTERVYRKLSYLLSSDKLLTQYKEWLEDPQRLSASSPTPDLLDDYLTEAKAGHGPAPITTVFVVDILSGTSAGGINAIFLAKALANNQSIEKLKKLWVEEGDIGLLINDRQSLAGLHLKNQDPPKSLLNSRRMYLQLLKAFDRMDVGCAREPGYQSPYVKELDLFVTTTDI